MSKRRTFLITALAAAPAGAGARDKDSGPAAAPAELVYRVAMPDPRTHELEIELEVPALPGREAPELVMPAWAPGSYMVRDFARHLYGLEATDGKGRILPTERLDKQRWRVRSGGAPFRVRYRVFAFEISVRTSFLDEEHAFWNGSSVFLFVDGELGRPCLLRVVPPPGRDWKVSTALPLAGTDAGPAARRSAGARRAATPGKTAGPGRSAEAIFRARDYDELVDSPVEVGTHAVHRFRALGADFEVALVGRTNADVPRLLRDMQAVVEAAGGFFGGFPFERYLFIVHAYPSGSGGLEHMASATLDIAGLGFEDEKAYQSFAGLVAHEFFHVWNVKRIHDEVLGPFDYTRENYSRLLWLHEGFTDYMSRLILLRSGVWKEKDLYRYLGEEWPRYVQRPGRHAALDELSFEAWIKEYKPADNHANVMVSYYSKGNWAGMALDLMLRARSLGAAGVPDVFKRLWEDKGRAGKGITLADVRAAVAAVAGAPMEEFFARYILGGDEIPIPALLRGAGLQVEERAAWEADEPVASGGNGAEAVAGAGRTGRNGKPEERDRTKDARAHAWSGVVLAPPTRRGTDPTAGPALVRNVVPDSPAFAAGLTYGDEIVAVEGARVDAGTFPKRIADRKPGDTIEISYFRQERLRDTRLQLVESPERRLVVKPDPKADAAAQAIRKGWLGELGGK